MGEKSESDERDINKHQAKATPTISIKSRASPTLKYLFSKKLMNQDNQASNLSLNRVVTPNKLMKLNKYRRSSSAADLLSLNSNNPRRGSVIGDKI